MQCTEKLSSVGSHAFVLFHKERTFFSISSALSMSESSDLSECEFVSLLGVFINEVCQLIKGRWALPL